MLSCKDITERVTEYLERDLSPWDRVQFSLHLAMCRFCRRYVSQMRTTVATLRRVVERSPEPTSPLDASLREALHAWRHEQL